MAQAPEWLVVGKILNAFGTKGEVRVRVDTDFPEERFKLGGQLFIEREPQPLTIEGLRWHQGRPLIKLHGVNDRDQAEALRGRLLSVPGGDLAALEEGEFYVFQIVGLAVADEAGQQLGVISEVLQTGANDVYVVPTAAGELLVPAIEEVVRAVNLADGRMTVHLLPGMLPGSEE